MTDLVRIVRDQNVARITIHRPEVNNALNEGLIEAMKVAFESIAADASISIVVLSGEGKSLCAGADINWMRKAAAYGRAENIADLMPLGTMLRTLNRMPQTVIAVAHGPIYGGGVGLVAACDIAIGATDATFCLSEVKLGIAPGMISPFVLRAIGQRSARRYFQSAEVFDAAEARRLGLLHDIVAADALNDRVAQLVQQLKSTAPGARNIAKAVALDIAVQEIDDALMLKIAELIADARARPEGVEGLSAFLEKRKASWS